jgi:hypothetical protein
VKTECFVCSKELEDRYLCEAHAKELKRRLDNKIGLISNPAWPHHCCICGEYENLKIIEFRPNGYFCDKDILDEYKKYNSD